MTYSVVYTPDVIAAIEAHVTYLLDHDVSVERIEHWLSKLYDHTAALSEFRSAIRCQKRQRSRWELRSGSSSMATI